MLLLFDQKSTPVTVVCIPSVDSILLPYIYLQYLFECFMSDGDSLIAPNNDLLFFSFVNCCPTDLICWFVHPSIDLRGANIFFHFQLLLCSMSPISPIFWGEQVSLSHSMPSCFYLFGYMICMKRPNKWMSSCCVSLLFFAYLVWLTFCSDLGNALVLDFLCSVFWRESWFVRPLYLISLAGHPALIGRHRPFLVTHRAAERWLHHMRQALDTTESIDADSKTKMMNFFRSVQLINCLWILSHN